MGPPHLPPTQRWPSPLQLTRLHSWPLRSFGPDVPESTAALHEEVECFAASLEAAVYVTPHPRKCRRKSAPVAPPTPVVVEDPSLMVLSPVVQEDPTLYVSL